jgi:hypothetical protein
MTEEAPTAGKPEANSTATLRERFAEMKKKLASLPMAERVAQEVRLAREAGITVTATEAASIARPMERLHRVHPDIAEPVAHPPCALEGGQASDLAARANLAAAMRETGLFDDASAAIARDMVRRLGEGDPAALEELLTRATPHLELLAVRGDSAGLLAQAREAVARIAFGHVDAGADRNGAAGTRNP